MISQIQINVNDKSRMLVDVGIKPEEALFLPGRKESLLLPTSEDNPFIMKQLAKQKSLLPQKKSEMAPVEVAEALIAPTTKRTSKKIPLVELTDKSPS